MKPQLRRGGLGWSGGRWRLAFRHEEPGSALRGALVAPGLGEVEVSALEERPRERTHDLLLLNRLATAGRFVEAVGEIRATLAHEGFTEVLAPADVDCDGMLDVMALRAGEPGAANGGPVLLRSAGGGALVTAAARGLSESGHDLYTADQLVVGFIDGDLRPDLFVTHGGGLRPGSLGPSPT